MPQSKLQRVKNSTNGTRKVWKLQNGWVDLFLDLFFEQYGLPCSYSIKYHHVSSEGSNATYISFKGKCSDQKCHAVIIGNIYNMPKPGENVVLNISTINTMNIKHNKKRFLREPKRSAIGKDLVYDGSCNWRRRMADQSMDYGDAEPPNLYRSSVLRKTKQQYVDKTLGVEGNDPISSIISLKHEVKYNGSIHNIGCDPFFVHYWLPIQEHIYRQNHGKSWNTISVDATGSLVLPIIRTKNKIPSAHIFLYQIITEVDGQTVPLCQQLSEKQDMLSIYYWMANWVNTGISPPDECVCDYSKALIGAITRSLCNRKSLHEYINTCFSYLISDKNILPECYVRIDIAHMIHMICRWKCLSVRKPVKDFYVRSIGLLIKTQDIEDFKKILEMIIIIACAETDGDTDNKLHTPAENSRKNLMNFISRGDTEIPPEEFHDYKGINESDFFEDADSDNVANDDSIPTIQNWISDIKNKAIEESSVKGDRLNALHCPNLVKPLLRICYEFPLWSAVMVPHFGSPNQTATSARVEGYFSTLKSSILSKKVSRMRVDKFLVTHLNSIRGDLKLIGSNNFQEVNEKNQNFESDLEFFDDLYLNNDKNIVLGDKASGESNYTADECGELSSSSDVDVEEKTIENWKNKAQQPPQKKVKRSKYLNSHPEIKMKQKVNQKQVRHRLDIIKNGNLVRPLPINSNKFKATNTCAFDSIVQAVATAYLDSRDYATFIDNSDCKILKFSRSLVHNGANNQLYKERLNILQEYSKKLTLVGQITEYDARANVATLTDKLFSKAPSINQFHTCDNYKCGQTTHNISLFPIDQGKLILGIYFILMEIHYN